MFLPAQTLRGAPDAAEDLQGLRGGRAEAGGRAAGQGAQVSCGTGGFEFKFRALSVVK